MDMPAADIDVTPYLITALLAEQHPDLASLPLTLVGNGWDNVIYRLGDELCVRLPRRRIAVAFIENEQRWLPTLAPHLPVPIPVPVRLGRPTLAYPWPWSVCRWIDGTPAHLTQAAERRPLAADLARFMAALHTDAPPAAPRNPVRGVDLAERAAAVEERLASGTLPKSAELRARWADLVAAPRWAGPPQWIHGDPHPANMLVQAGRLVAVLDFGDLTAGDPATDLAAAWMVFDAAGRAVFQAELSDVDDATWARAQGWALNIGTAIAVHADDSPAMAAIGTHTLAMIMES